jgi:CheY-like chemotaxis protein
VTAAETWYEIVLPPIVTLGVIVLGFGLLWLFRGRLVQLVEQLNLQRVSAFGVDIQFAEQRTVAAYTKQELKPPSKAERTALRDGARFLGPLAAQSRVLWVDDKPANNELERSALLAFEVDVQSVRTTDEAIRELKDTRQRFDLLISDWHRPEPGDSLEHPAGVDFLRRVGELHLEPKPRLIYYHGRVKPMELAARRDLAHKLGALGTTASPGELLRWSLLELARIAIDAPSPEQQERRERLVQGTASRQSDV